MTLASDFVRKTGVNQTTAEFSRCAFKDFGADFGGQAVFNSLGQLRLSDTHIVPPDGETLATGTVFDFGGNSDCQSGCPSGSYGTCEPVDNCYSCVIGACNPCPRGTFRAEPGAVAEAQCLPCPSGTFSEEGAAACGECAAGSYVTLLASVADGFGTSSGAEACVSCPAGRATTDSGSVQCFDCKAANGKEYSSPPGSTSCVCDQNFYDADTSSNDVSCRPCPDGAICALGTELATIAAKPGFYRFGPDSDELYECRMGKEACPGSQSGSAAAVTSYGDELCGEGYTAPLCGALTSLAHLHVSLNPPSPPQRAAPTIISSNRLPAPAPCARPKQSTSPPSKRS